jgi:putative hemolysin
MNGIQFLIGIVLIIVLLGGLWGLTKNIKECETDQDCIPENPLLGVSYFCENGVCKTKPFGNPADMFCEEKGGKVEIRTDPRPENGQYSVCILPNGTECDSWAYYRGGCDNCITYCLKQPHIMCVGDWNITGEYPNCRCGFSCTSSDKNSCTSNSDCVPSACCHPDKCVNKNYQPDCEGIFCTMDCKPNTMDCGQGKCICKNNVCQVEWS